MYLAFQSLTVRAGTAIVPDYNFAFFNLPVMDLPLWDQARGSALGALLALVASWIIATLVRRDWRELAAGVLLLIGTVGLQIVLDDLGPEIEAFLNPRFGSSTFLMTSLLVPSAVMGGYSYLVDRMAGRQSCRNCGEGDFPGYSRVCPLCGAPIAEETKSALA